MGCGNCRNCAATAFYRIRGVALELLGLVAEKLIKLVWRYEPKVRQIFGSMGQVSRQQQSPLRLYAGIATKRLHP